MPWKDPIIEIVAATYIFIMFCYALTQKKYHAYVCIFFVLLVIKKVLELSLMQLLSTKVFSYRHKQYAAKGQTSKSNL